MRLTTPLLVGLFGWFGCRDSHPPPPSPHVPPLLGTRTDEVIDLIGRTCPTGRIVTGDGSSGCMLKIGSYGIHADRDGRIYDVSMSLLDDRELHETFTRALAPVLPDETRALVEASIDQYSGQPGTHKLYARADHAIWMQVQIEGADGVTKGRKTIGWVLDQDWTKAPK